MVDLKTLLRADVEFISDLLPDRAEVLATARAIVRKMSRRSARGPKGTMIDCDIVAYLSPEEKTHGAAFARINATSYAVAFVDTDFNEERPVRVGLCEIK